jgi:hypothetical protein
VETLEGNKGWEDSQTISLGHVSLGHTAIAEDASLLSLSKGRDAWVVEIFQRFLSLEPFEHEESMDTECPHRKHDHKGDHVSAIQNHAGQERPTMAAAGGESQP